ncbi:unnamed protein product [Nezara viridula]|uniref:Uncharacterized protein n=1 Tax=Nezara viridula TaxID=85310 RepID=A0A9P0MRG3_NEZVI|nr:unnamed protein product [Nezara viridula]
MSRPRFAVEHWTIGKDQFITSGNLLPCPTRVFNYEVSLAISTFDPEHVGHNILNPSEDDPGDFPDPPTWLQIGASAKIIPPPYSLLQHTSCCMGVLRRLARCTVLDGGRSSGIYGAIDGPFYGSSDVH